MWPWLAMLGVGVTAALAVWVLLRRAGYGWLVPYVAQTGRRRFPKPEEEVHLLLCMADHFEPMVGRPSEDVAKARVERWRRDYPLRFGEFRDSDGRPPRHTFFYPPEEYDSDYLDAIAELCRAGFGEVEIHIHHDKDTAEGFRRTLLDFKQLLADRHGLLARRRDTGELAYGFIHGNWSLCNSLPDGSWCGVNNELDILRETGCFADFTLPSVPSPTQTRTINSLYYAWDRPGRPKSHNTGRQCGAGVRPPNSLLMIQGPLLLNWRRRKWGLLPRLENACLQGNQPPSMERLDHWLTARIQVPTRPDWYFVKLHTHGAPEWNADMLLGQPMTRFHESLAQRAATNPRFHYHYVTAREMFNLARAAEAGWPGSVDAARDFELVANGGTRATLDSAALPRGADNQRLPICEDFGQKFEKRLDNGLLLQSDRSL